MPRSRAVSFSLAAAVSIVSTFHKGAARVMYRALCSELVHKTICSSEEAECAHYTHSMTGIPSHRDSSAALHAFLHGTNPYPFPRQCNLQVRLGYFVVACRGYSYVSTVAPRSPSHRQIIHIYGIQSRLLSSYWKYRPNPRVPVARSCTFAKQKHHQQWG